MQTKREAAGRETDDLGQHSTWRQTAAKANLDALDFYARYGQFVPMGRALSLDAIRAGFDIEGIDRDEWPEMTERLLILHAAFVETLTDR